MLEIEAEWVSIWPLCSTPSRLPDAADFHVAHRQLVPLPSWANSWMARKPLPAASPRPHRPGIEEPGVGLQTPLRPPPTQFEYNCGQAKLCGHSSTRIVFTRGISRPSR